MWFLIVFSVVAAPNSITLAYYEVQPNQAACLARIETNRDRIIGEILEHGDEIVPIVSCVHIAVDTPAEVDTK